MQYIAALRTLRASAVFRLAPPILFSATRSTASMADEVSCVGWDGGPLLSNGREGDTGRGRGKEEEGEETEDDRTYFAKHKPSPLSEVEFVDPRKPITQATSHGGDDREGYCLVRESVDDALRRAEEMWWAAKVRGVPDSPQSRALAGMLGQRF